MSTVYVYPAGGTKRVIVQDRQLCSGFEEIDQNVITKDEFSRFIQMWRKRVNMKQRIDFELNLPGLTLVGLMPDSPMAIHVEIIDPDSDEPTFITTYVEEKTMAKKKAAAKKTAKTDKAAKAATASKKTEKRGREPKIDCEPGETIKEPREGSMKARVLAKARRENGTTINEIEKLYEKEFEGKEMKTPARTRAFEILKLLNVQNGFGFETEGNKIFAIEE